MSGPVFPWRSDNRFALLNDGVRFFPRMLLAIEAAQRSIELELYRMVTTLGVMGQRRIQAQIEQRLDKLRGDLQVLREGGTVQRMVQLNLEGQDQMLREVSYTPPPGDERYVMELIELAPYLDQIQNKSTELMVMLGRSGCLSKAAIQSTTRW